MGLKEKSKISFFYLVLATLLLSVTGGFLMSPSKAEARNEAEGAGCFNARNSSTGGYTDNVRVCMLEHIVLTTDIIIGGQKVNFIKVGPNDSIVFDVSVTLKSPPDLKVETGPVISSGADEIYFSGTFNTTITGFGASAVPQNTAGFCKSVGVDAYYTKCESDGKVGTSSLLLSSSKGPYDDYKEYSTLTTFQAGSEVFHTTFTIPPSDFQRMGITHIKDNPAGDAGLNEILVYPNVLMHFTSADDWTSYFSGGAPIVIERYSSDTAKNADATNPPACVGPLSNGTSTPPSCIPGSGGVTSGGNNIGGGSSILGLINQILGAILGLVNEFLFLVFYALVAPFIQAVLSIHTYTDTFVGVIYPAWIIIRNFCDIMFIVAIIAIAMATLFRVESYQYKHLLVQLIIAALLVNFSLVIGQAVLGIADTMQNQFLPNNTEVIRSLAKGMMLDYRTQVYTTNFSNQGYFTDTIKPLFFLSLALGTFAVFVAIAAFLVVRIVALWILLMISPVAYVAAILPITEEYRKEWWKNFIHYAFFTPIMALLLNLAANIYILQASNPVLKQIMTQPVSDLGDSSMGAFVVGVSSNLILLVFLFVALNVANKLGIVGGDIASKWGKTALSAPFLGAGFLAKRGGGKLAMIYNEQTSKLVTDKHGLGANLKKGLFAVVNPVNFFRGWEERAKEKKEWAHEMAKGAGQMVASELLTGGKELINYKELALQKIQNGLASKLRESLGDDPGRAPAMDLQRRIGRVKGLEGKLLQGATAKLVGDQGWNDDTNEVASDTEHDRHYWMDQLKKRGTNAEGIKLFKEACVTYDDQGFETIQWVYQGLDLNMLAKLRADKGGKIYERDAHDPHKYADKEFQGFIEKNQLGLMNVASLTNGAKKVGHYEQMFMAKKDDKSGLFIPLVDSDEAKLQLEADPENFEANSTKAVRTNEIIGEVNKIGIRPFWQNTAWHTLLRKVKKDKNGKTLKAADWDKDGEWGVGNVSDDGGSLMQQYLWKKTMAGKKYASQAGHAQARIVGYVVGKCFDSKGKILASQEKEYKKMYDDNPDLVKILTFVQLTGNPPIEKEGMDAAAIAAQLPDLLVRHGNVKPAYMP